MRKRRLKNDLPIATLNRSANGQPGVLQVMQVQTKKPKGCYVGTYIKDRKQYPTKFLLRKCKVSA